MTDPILANDHQTGPLFLFPCFPSTEAAYSLQATDIL
jgi:hypothetical protein